MCMQSVVPYVIRDNVGQEQESCPLEHPRPSRTFIVLGFVKRPENENM